jgi:hypothetical protein
VVFGIKEEAAKFKENRLDRVVKLANCYTNFKNPNKRNFPAQDNDGINSQKG